MHDGYFDDKELLQDSSVELQYKENALQFFFIGNFQSLILKSQIVFFISQTLVLHILAAKLGILE